MEVAVRVRVVVGKVMEAMEAARAVVRAARAVVVRAPTK